ncbi:Uncharacterised protein [Neisseria animalis]|nr:Uncharacterised protein [Neisseria animalis]
MIQRCFALPYYVYCLRLCCLVSFLFYSTIFPYFYAQIPITEFLHFI